MKKTFIFLTVFMALVACKNESPTRDEVLGVIDRVNTYWQENNTPEVRPFWDNAAYHTGNMEVYFLTGNEEQLAYTKRWAEPRSGLIFLQNAISSPICRTEKVGRVA